MSFEKLKAYQAAMRLRRELDQLRNSLDPQFIYAFEHVSRAADSILLNLAEGSDSEYPAKRVVFYDTARNSANEAWSGLRFIQVRGGFTSKSALKTCTLAYAVTKLIAGLIQEAKSRGEAARR